MMADIYRRAVCVRVWLGPSDRSSDTAILFVKEEILQLLHFDDLSKNLDASEKWKSYSHSCSVLGSHVNGLCRK